MSSGSALKRLSSVFFGCNYAGIVFNAFTTNFSGEKKDEEQRKVSGETLVYLFQLFVWTAAKHAVFMGNNYLIHLLKFEMGPFRMLNLANDLGAFLCCFPSYFILAYPKISSYFGGAPDSDKAKVEIASGSLEQ